MSAVRSSALMSGVVETSGPGEGGGGGGGKGERERDQGKRTIQIEINGPPLVAQC
jgi:hypothetical protein